MESHAIVVEETIAELGRQIEELTFEVGRMREPSVCQTGGRRKSYKLPRPPLRK